jgi:hypothetical protein
MTTALHKSVCRRTETTVRDGAKRRRLVVTIYPSGMFGLRPEKTRREETIDFESVYSMAVKQRVAFERVQKKKAKALK